MRRIELREVSAWFGAQQVLDRVSMTIEPNQVTSLVGPSGSGKSTLLRVINRLHEESPGARHEGEVLIDGKDIYATGVDPASIRRSVGLVAQSPTPFPPMSVLENVVCGLRFNGVKKRSVLNERAEEALHLVGLWEDVADRLHKPARSLSIGQQQRLCIARALAVGPQILLLDEPCSALDPISTLFIEQLMKALTAKLTVVVVTHNLQQAARVSEDALLLSNDEPGGPGRVIEAAPTIQLFTEPQDRRAEAYLSGRLS